ncbi:Ammonia transport outward protein 2 [Galdieria sulphuraria]|nr:Ammonia transport outward protein 2 [Galdieria sulphuraria]
MEVASIMSDVEKCNNEKHQIATLNDMEWLAGFACTTFILSVLNAKLLPSEITNGVVGPGFFYGGTTQFVAGLMCFITGNTFGFVGLTSYGAFWLASSYWHPVGWLRYLFLVPLEMTLILLALSSFGVISSVPGGVTGILLALGGWYISAAIFINENYQRTVIPLGPSQSIPFLRKIAPHH